MNPICPRCRMGAAVEQDVSQDVFSASSIYVCSPFPGRHGGGCGYRWDEVIRSIEDAAEAVRRIPVTDVTVTRRANSLAHLEGLAEELTVSHRRSA